MFHVFHGTRAPRIKTATNVVANVFNCAVLLSRPTRVVKQFSGVFNYENKTLSVI